MTTPRFIIFGLAALSALPATALTLENALQAARDNNPSIEAATQRLAAASEAIVAARSGYLPTITLSGGYTLTDNPPQAFFMNLNQRVASLQEDFNQPDDTDNYRGSIAFKMLLLDAGQRGLMTGMARQGEAAASAMLDAAHNELAFQVTRAFHSVHQAAAFVKVREETITSLEENLRVARERLEAGSAIKTDVLNLEVQLAEARENLISAQNGLSLALAALNTAVGTSFAQTPGELTAPDAQAITSPPEAIDLDRVEQRPELRAAQSQAQAARLDASRARRDRMPRISAFGSLDFDSGDASDFEDSYLVGAMAEIDLFTGFRRGAEIASAKAREMEAEASRQQLMNQLTLDATQSHLKAKEAWERSQVARQSLGSAEEALRITRERYEQGAADITELLTAQVGLTANQSRAVAAHYDYLIANANLQRALGLLASAHQP